MVDGGASTAVLARLTKSATLFACLQHRTFERTKGELMGRVLWDVITSSREKEDVVAGTIEETQPEDSSDLTLPERTSLDDRSPTPMQLDTIDMDDAMTIVDNDEYEAVTSALPPTSLPQSTSTAFYEVTTETTVTKTTTVQFINSTQQKAQPIETQALRSRQVNTTSEQSKYKIAVQKVTDKLKVKKLQKPLGPQITEIGDEENDAERNVVKKAFNRAKRGFSPTSSAVNSNTKRQESSRRVRDLDIPTNDSRVPAVRARDTKANILRTQAQTKPPEPQTRQLVRTAPAPPSPPLPPRPPPRNTSLFRPTDRDRERIPSPTRLRGRRNSTISITSFLSLRSDTHHHSTFTETPNSPTSFPPGHQVENLARFMRFSSASYGWNFMRLLGIGTLAESGIPSGSLHHANHHAFAQHTKLPLSNILLSSFTTQALGSQAPQLVHFVSVDHEIGAVVLTCRGTLGVADILTDLACDYEDLEVWGNIYPVHKGMLACARQLCGESSRVCTTIKDALTTNPGYGLVLCGHSLVSNFSDTTDGF